MSDKTARERVEDAGCARKTLAERQAIEDMEKIKLSSRKKGTIVNVVSIRPSAKYAKTEVATVELDDGVYAISTGWKVIKDLRLITPEDYPVRYEYIVEKNKADSLRFL